MAGEEGSLRRWAGALQNRLAERRALDRVVTAVRDGGSRVLVVHGEPGVGKSVLLDYLSEQAAGCQVARAIGVQSEMELAFAGLHQLLTPMLERVDDLPVPQRDALRTVFGMETGPVPDRFLVGLGVLSLLSDAAGERPLICLVDDEQWLDQASVQVLGFVARRLGADPVAMVFATRMPREELTGLPRLAVDGLREPDARALLNSVLTQSLDEQVRDQLIAETRGNPLALLELPRGLSPAELAGGFGLPAAVPLTDRIEGSFRRQLDDMPPDTLRLLRLAAAETSGDPTLLWRAAERLGIPLQAAVPATESGLAQFGARVRFRHPLLRSAAYRSASPSQRLDMHRALAEVIDPLADPDRRAWHRAQAAAGPDEAVAAELEHCAARARDRGGLAAAAAFLERSVVLTADPASRAERTPAAAQVKLQAGAFGKALELVAAAEAGPMDELQGARADLLRGRIAFASGPGSDAPPLLLKAAKRLEPLDLDLSRQTYVDAWQAAVFVGHLAGAGDLLEVSHAARALPPPAHPPRPIDLLLDGFAVLVLNGPTSAAPLLRQATTAFARADLPVEESLQWGWLARVADKTLWDDVGLPITSRQVRLAREAGALDHLSIVLNMMAMDAVWGGDLVAAASVVAEEDAVREATGSRNLPYGTMMLAAYRGREQEAAPLIQATAEQVMAGGQGAALTNAYWMAAILYNGLGRYADALTAARQASEHRHLYASSWAWPELIEAAVRADGADEARVALDLLARTTRAGGTDLGLGIEARCRALLAEGDAAEGHYQEAIDRLARTRRRPDLARAHLLYGEWLRRERRRGDAQRQLRTAWRMLDEMGMEAFAERARRELRATGETIRTHRRGSLADGTTLTAQETQVARLAADGLSNPDIAARLFISVRTVQYHLSKVFSKLGIGSRTELHLVLPGEPDLATER